MFESPNYDPSEVHLIAYLEAELSVDKNREDYISAIQSSGTLAMMGFVAGAMGDHMQEMQNNIIEWSGHVLVGVSAVYITTSAIFMASGMKNYCDYRQAKKRINERHNHIANT